MPELYLATSEGRTRLNFKMLRRVGGDNPDPDPEPPDPETPWQPAYPGQPAPGTVLWGTSLAGNSDPYNKHEQPTGVRVGVRRTFQSSWGQTQVNNMANIAAGDLAAGRLPWVSIKPASWAAMAAGTHDTLIDNMLTQLDALNGPVWLTINHEPDGVGGGNNTPDDPAGPAGHLAMNARVRQRMTALGTDNIALAPILMSYTWHLPMSAPHRNPELWWDSDVYDFMGVDHYREDATLITPRWNTIRTWGYNKGVDINIGEWGLHEYSGIDAFVHEWHNMAINSAYDTGRARVSGLSYFDSNIGSTGNWTLTETRLAAFHQRLQHPQSAHWQ